MDRPAGRGAARSAAAARRSPRRRPLPGCPDRRRPPLPGEPAGRGRRRRRGGEPRRADVAERGPLAYVRDACTGETFEVRRALSSTPPGRGSTRCGGWRTRAGTSVTLSRGAHLVLERVGGWGAAVTIPIDRTRVAFAVPGRTPWSGRRTCLRGRRPVDRADRGRGAADPRRGRARPRGRCARVGAWALRGHPSPAGGGGRDCTRSPRDDALLRAARDGLGRRRQADHVPPDRARGAAPAPVRARELHRIDRARGCRPAPPTPTSRRTPCGAGIRISTQVSRRTWPARTARARTT